MENHVMSAIPLKKKSEKDDSSESKSNLSRSTVSQFARSIDVVDTRVVSSCNRQRDKSSHTSRHRHSNNVDFTFILAQLDVSALDLARMKC